MLFNKNNKKDLSISVALVGNYPPSCGGVQVHIYRLHKLLIHSNVKCKIYCPQQNEQSSGNELSTVHRPWWGKRYLNYWGYHWFTEYGLHCNELIIHCHEQWKMAPAMLGMILRKKKIIMTIHDQMIDVRWKKILPIDRAASRLLVRSRRVWWIAVSLNVESQLLDIGVPPERIFVIPAFIPPVAEEQAREKLPPNIREFVEQHSPVISTYGWMLILDENGNDLHSFDHCIDLIKELIIDFPSVGLIMCIAAVTNHDYHAELKKRIGRNGLEQNILVLTEPLTEGHLLWKYSDIYIRATTTDGDSVSVREALSLQVPVVASDAAARPDGTVIFKTRDFLSLSHAVRSVLADKERHVLSLKNIDSIDTFSKILSLYERVNES